MIRPLHLLAWINLIVHVVGLAFAALAMRQGTPLVPLDERLAYLATKPPGWSLGWGVWMLCVVVLVVLLAAIARRLPDAPFAWLAVTLAVAGGVADLLCDVIHLFVTPELARLGEWRVFVAFETLATAGGLIVANGLYTVAALVMTLCLRGRPGVSRWLVPVGWGVFACGMTMVLAGFLRWPPLVEWSTGPTILLFCVWGLLAARSLEGRA